MSDNGAGAGGTDGEQRPDTDASERRLSGSRASVLTAGLALAVGLALLGVVSVSMTPTVSSDPYTEFYVLGPNGSASGYPINLSIGETGSVVVGITNHEGTDQSYRIEAAYDDRTLETYSLTVAHEQTWEQPVSFEAQSAGRKQLDLFLYRAGSPNGTGEPYREARVLVIVTRDSEGPTASRSSEFLPEYTGTGILSTLGADAWSSSAACGVSCRTATG